MAGSKVAVLPRYLVIRDTGEKKGWTFEESDRCAGTVERNLFTADYSITIEGEVALDCFEQKLFVVERKGSVAEFVGNLSNKEKWDDFRQVLERMEDFRHAFLVLEFPCSLIKSWPVGSGVPKSRWPQLRCTPQFLMKRIAEIELAFKTKILFLGSDAHDYVSSLFKRMVEKYGVRQNKSV